MSSEDRVQEIIVWLRERAGFARGTNKPESFSEAADLLESLADELIAVRKDRKKKSDQLHELMTNSSAVYMSLLRGALPITRAQLLHAAGLDANIADQAALWQKVEQLAEWDMMERKWTAQWHGEFEHAGPAEALRRTGSAT